MKNKLLSICIPTFNKGSHLSNLLQLLEPLHDIAELCIFDNGSTDGTEAIVENFETKLQITYERVPITGPIDYSWLSALKLARCSFKKLQLGDDLPNAQNIRDGLHQLKSSTEDQYIISSCAVVFGESSASKQNLLQQEYFDKASELRQRIATLRTAKQRAEFAFGVYSSGNNLGDINGVIFRSNALEGMSTTFQKYYTCITHPDAEIFLNLLANGTSIFFEKPFSIYNSSSESPVSRSAESSKFAQKVYVIPEITHGLCLILDPSLSLLRRNVGLLSYYKFIVRFGRSLFGKIRRTSRLDESLRE